MKRVVKTPEESPRHEPPPQQVQRARVRGKDEFTADELALLQAKLEGWIRATATKAESKRPRHQFVIKFKHTERV
jgi:hypothetical protein